MSKHAPHRLVARAGLALSAATGWPLAFVIVAAGLVLHVPDLYAEASLATPSCSSLPADCADAGPFDRDAMVARACSSCGGSACACLRTESCVDDAGKNVTQGVCTGVPTCDDQDFRSCEGKQAGDPCGTRQGTGTTITCTPSSCGTRTGETYTLVPKLSCIGWPLPADAGGDDSGGSASTGGGGCAIEGSGRGPGGMLAVLAIAGALMVVRIGRARRRR